MGNLLQRILGHEAADLGATLAESLSHRFPQSLVSKGVSKISADRLSRILEKIYGEAQAQQEAHQLGFFRRTRLCHAFKWKLLDSGYDKNFVDLATEGLIVYLSKAKVARPTANNASRGKTSKS